MIGTEVSVLWAFLLFYNTFLCPNTTIFTSSFTKTMMVVLSTHKYTGNVYSSTVYSCVMSTSIHLSTSFVQVCTTGAIYISMYPYQMTAVYQVSAAVYQIKWRVLSRICRFFPTIPKGCLRSATLLKGFILCIPFLRQPQTVRNNG